MVKPLEKYPVLIIGSTGCAYTTQSHGRKQGQFDKVKGPRKQHIEQYHTNVKTVSTIAKKQLLATFMI